MYTASRRLFLVASAAGLTAPLSRPQEVLPDTPRRRKLNVIVTGGHPGDPEYGCGGTVARYADLGHQVTLLYLNKGGKGCAQKTELQCSSIRSLEAENACKILGARPVFSSQADGAAVVDPPHYAAFQELIQQQKPDVLFTHWPIDNHPDHRAISMLAYNAWLQMKQTFAFYYYEVSDGEDTMMFAPTDYVDISGTESRKRAACYAHASQAPDKFYSLQSEVSRFRGTESGHVQAEAFIRHVKSPGNFLP